MKEHVQGSITAGIALVGAGVIAATSMASPPALAPATELASASTAVDLMASPADLLAAGGSESALRLATGTAGLPLGLIPIAQALADRDNSALYLAIRQYIDGPLWVADPTIFALDNVLPSPFGGDLDENPQTADGSLLTAFRADVLWAATYGTRSPIAAALGVSDAGVPLPNAQANIPATLAVGFAGSAVRFAESAALAPLGPVKVATDVAGGKEFNQALYEAARNYIDAPLYVADPTIFAIDDALPAPLGGGVNDDPATSHGSQVTDFRNNVLWKTTSDIRTPIRDALGAVDPVSTSNARVGSSTLGIDEAAAPVAKKPERKSVLGSNTKAVGSHRAQSNNPVRAAVKKIRESVKSTAASADK